MPANVLIVVIDGLRASALGAYGNTSFATPALDRFAAESLLMDWCFAPAVELADIYRALWQTQEFFGTKAADHSLVSLPRLFSNEGYYTTLVSDEPLLNSFVGAADFDEIAEIVAPSESGPANEHANDPSETDLAFAFSSALDQISGGANDKPRLVWLHSRGMYSNWDAPLSLQRLLLDESDSPIESAAPPDLFVTADHDPDTAFRYACAYAAQTIVLDMCWESLLEATSDASRGEWLIVLIGARGFPLGEHGRIGGIDPRAHAEQLQVPWLIRFPSKLGQLARAGMLTSHQDLLPTLLDWFDRDHNIGRTAAGSMSVLPFASAAAIDWRGSIVSESATSRSIRTAAWCLREDSAAAHQAATSREAISIPELYVRPDDRWEANDVAKLCPEVVAELRAALSTTSSETQ